MSQIDCKGCTYESDKAEIKSKTYNPDRDENKVDPAPCSKCVRFNDDHYTKKAD